MSFLLERDTIQSICDHLDQAHSQSVFYKEADDPRKLDMLLRLRETVAKHEADAAVIFAGPHASDLAKRNFTETGLYNNFIEMTMFMQFVYKRRLKELEEQEALFWNVKSRPPNYYARTIALRFAKFYARQKSEKPTFGISRDGPHPSTEYGRILEEVFRILGIEGAVRGPAKWAISQITDDDLKPPFDVMGTILGKGASFSGLPLPGLGGFPLLAPPKKDEKGSS